MLKVDYEHCSGCGACVQKCPKGCISWERGELGFRYPVIDETSCINCHLCEKTCPIGKKLEVPELQIVSALVNKDADILSHSTSGGAFTAIAERVLEEGGAVYGCSIEDDFQVRHIRVTDGKKLEKLRGSKYVQSDTAETFKLAKQDIDAGKRVLFSGTPCQIVGLRHFLGTNAENLLTIDIVCHGVGSQSYFDKFIEDLKRREGHIVELRFRDKKYVGWSCGGGSVVVASPYSSLKKEERPFYNHENYYYSYFLSGDIYRKACYSCPYASVQRQGDITLGDFWGIEALKLPIDSYNGCSLVIANTQKGNKLISALKNVTKVATSAEAAMKHNHQLVAPSALKESRAKRIFEYERMSGREIQEAYLRGNKGKLIKGKIKTLVPYDLKRILRGLRG